MGALHEGHLELVREAKKAAYHCVVSIFVNPRQFNNAEDLRHYPRSIQSDLDRLRDAGADCVFVPYTKDLYEGESKVDLDISPLDSVFEGHYRPGHYKGVVEVLHRLFSVIRPDDVYFGLKDLQQCMVIEKLVKAHFSQIRQHNLPTIREHSGLAMSSRNRRLSPEGLLNAPEIFHQLRSLAENAADFAGLRSEAVDNLRSKGIETEYLSLVRLPDMQEEQRHEAGHRDAIVFAGYLEGVRLIDNVILDE